MKLAARIVRMVSIVVALHPVQAAAVPEVLGLTPCAETRECLQWSAAVGATRYHVYRGALGDLPGLDDASLDVCERGTFSAPTSGPTLPDAPTIGDLLWYLVTAESEGGEGSVGSGSSGIRIPNSRGSCATACDPDYEPRPNAGRAEAPGGPGCPTGMVTVSAFCIDAYEASLVNVEDGSPWSPYLNPGATPVQARSVANAIPQAYISGAQAAAACQNAGKRLCTDSEWQRACRGPLSFTYPYGNTRDPVACNDARATHPASDYFGKDPWDLGHRCLDQLPDTVDPTGAQPACTTEEGVLDMVGNLDEWTADPNGTFRGGDYMGAQINGSGCLYRTTAHAFTHWDMSTGFRCCVTP